MIRMMNMTCALTRWPRSIRVILKSEVSRGVHCTKKEVSIMPIGETGKVSVDANLSEPQQRQHCTKRCRNRRQAQKGEARCPNQHSNRAIPRADNTWAPPRRRQANRPHRGIGRGARHLSRARRPHQSLPPVAQQRVHPPSANVGRACPAPLPRRTLRFAKTRAAHQEMRDAKATKRHSDGRGKETNLESRIATTAMLASALFGRGDSLGHGGNARTGTLRCAEASADV
jgi:hypothetical protein